MRGPLVDLLDWRTAILDDVLAGRRLHLHAANLLVLKVLGAATYGTVLGMWHGPMLAFYCAIKLPLVLVHYNAIVDPPRPPPSGTSAR